MDELKTSEKKVAENGTTVDKRKTTFQLPDDHQATGRLRPETRGSLASDSTIAGDGKVILVVWWTMTQERFDVRVFEEANTWQLKQIIGERRETPPTHLLLWYRGIELHDDDLLITHDIKIGSTVKCTMKQTSLVHVNFVNYEEKPISVRMEVDAKLIALKMLIAFRRGLQLSNLRVEHRQKCLLAMKDDETPISKLGIHDGTFITCSIKQTNELHIRAGQNEGGCFDITADADDTVLLLKQRIKAVNNMDEKVQRLTFQRKKPKPDPLELRRRGGREVYIPTPKVVTLEDHKRLCFYHIENESTISLTRIVPYYPPTPRTIPLALQFDDGQIYNADVRLEDSVKDLKQDIATRRGLPVMKEELLYNAILMDNDAIIENLPLKPGMKVMFTSSDMQEWGIHLTFQCIASRNKTWTNKKVYNDPVTIQNVKDQIYLQDGWQRETMDIKL